MRLFALALGLVLGAALLLAGPPAEAAGDALPSAPSAAAAADAPPLPAPAPRPGTEEESRDYALREARSPEVQEFAGGHTVTISVSILLLAAIVLLIILLTQD